MDFQVDIEYWEDSRGFSAVTKFILEQIPTEDQARIAKKNNHFRSLTFQQLCKTPFFEPVKGAKYPLWELKYLASKSMNYRALCILHKSILVILLIFKGSGSEGKLQKHFPQAIQRAEDWKRRN